MRRRRDARLEVHQAALDEELDRRERVADARGLHARLHLHVHQEVLEELVGRVDVRGGRVRAHLVQDVGDQRVALQAAQLVVDRLAARRSQSALVVAGAQGGLQIAHRVGVRLVGRRRDQRGGRNAQAL